MTEVLPLAYGYLRDDLLSARGSAKGMLRAAANTVITPHGRPAETVPGTLLHGFGNAWRIGRARGRFPMPAACNG
ncbi:hypothetical protein [Nocardia testacea]|uniref:hypothetical protein n=1 Tax=Nocardia testacea TaxID=248551 RepID=UPI00030274DA|nr:hypothetical protein [Nocardia testacea]